jgi:hypothetical protein
MIIMFFILTSVPYRAELFCEKGKKERPAFCLSKYSVADPFEEDNSSSCL